MSSPAPHEPTPSPPPSRSARGPWLVAGLVGLVLGVVLGALGGRLLPGSGSSIGSAAGDAGLACDYVRSIADDIDVDNLDLEEPPIWRLQATGALAISAAGGDPRYETLGEQGRDLYNGVARLDTELLSSTLQAMTDTCGSL